MSYLAGYVVRSIYQKRRDSKQWNTPRHKEIQSLMASMRVPTEANQYIASLSRGGLWAPHQWLVSIIEVVEVEFKRQTKHVSNQLPVDTILCEVLTNPLVKSLWLNIVDNCDSVVSKDCYSLCLENVIKLYTTVRCFSLARDIVNKYKLKNVSGQKGLRKNLKHHSEKQNV